MTEGKIAFFMATALSFLIAAICFLANANLKQHDERIKYLERLTAEFCGETSPHQKEKTDD